MTAIQKHFLKYLKFRNKIFRALTGKKRSIDECIVVNTVRLKGKCPFGRHGMSYPLYQKPACLLRLEKSFTGKDSRQHQWSSSRRKKSSSVAHVLGIVGQEKPQWPQRASPTLSGFWASCWCALSLTRHGNDMYCPFVPEVASEHGPRVREQRCDGKIHFTGICILEGEEDNTQT